jgi:phosphatidylethanolamine-binding protein (PEBP) family uncharacterized protein
VAAVALTAVLGACSTNDGRQLADPDPDLTRVTTTAPTATGEAARGGAAADLAIPVSSEGSGGLVVASPAFAAGASIPVEHTCDGPDRPPTVTWSGNADRQALALVVRDADGDGAVHWLVTDLGGAAGTLDPSDPTAGTVRPNDFGVAGWTGPCPGDDLEHRYVFTLYALPVATRLPADVDADALVGVLEAEHRGAATLLGVYARA